MANEFRQSRWCDAVARQAQRIAAWAAEEDLGGLADWTTNALIDESARSTANLVSRQPGRIAGLAAIPVMLATWEVPIRFEGQMNDGDAVAAGGCLGTLCGPTRTVLIYERPLLNLISRLSGIATFTAEMVAKVRDTGVAVYDTRKTTPGYRHLEKYAVHCGGGHNHRTGLFDAILIKDNHLAASGLQDTPEQAVRRARGYLASQPTASSVQIVEIEVDSLEQLRRVLPEGPDIVLLDNFSIAELTAAAAYRQANAPHCILEASGGVDRKTIAAIATTGVDRISCGALTHSAKWLDIGLDWNWDRSE